MARKQPVRNAYPIRPLRWVDTCCVCERIYLACHVAVAEWDKGHLTALCLLCVEQRAMEEGR